MAIQREVRERVGDATGDAVPIDPFAAEAGNGLAAPGAGGRSERRRESTDAHAAASAAAPRMTFRDFVERAPAVIYVAPAAEPRRLIYLSPYGEALLGYGAGVLDGQADFWSIVLHPEDRDWVLQELARVGEQGRPQRFEHRLITRDGRTLWVSHRVAPGSVTSHWYGAVVDITESRAAEEASGRRATNFLSLARATSDFLHVVDPSGMVLELNPSLGMLWERSPSDPIGGQAFSGWVHPEDVATFQAFLTACAHTPGVSGPVEVRLRRADAEWSTVEILASNLLAEPAVGGIVLSGRDITQRKQLEVQLAHQAFHDPLTNLPNRALFLDRLEHALARARRQGRVIAVLFVDLDNFKVINDSLGHEVGDRFLIQVAERLQACVRAGDTVARFGGDEFTLLLEDLAVGQEATEVADRIQEALRTPVNLHGRELVGTASIGIALSHAGHDHPQDLLRAADVALYRAKHLGKARHALFERGMTGPVHERLALELELRSAVAREEFRIEYQPMVDLQTGQILGVEALLRWLHPDRGLVAPGDFVAVAEETGLIVPVGQWVVEQACLQAQEWERRICAEAPIRINVNLSAYQFRHPTLVDDIGRALTASGLDPRQLTLEITESLMMEEGSDTRAVLQGLKALGVELAIDDFGTGYSSLSYLRRFAVDALKIDRSFIEELEHDPQHEALVAAIIAAGRALGLRVTAEGIETIAQLLALRRMGCQEGQGFLFARPAPILETGRLLDRGVLLPSVTRRPGRPRPLAS